MKSMTSNELREAFLRFFESHDHKIVRSSPLVPGNDPTLLFTNAGMVQFKDVFLGTEKRDYRRATTSQRCVRAGGKHNDLENVGYTARHHTFFEMLGNFSFGDYFKEDAIRFAWDFVTGTLGIPPDRLWVTVYKDDDEAAAIWIDEIGIDPARFSRLGEKDNFWAMGDTGPCGPCSEIFFDHGEDVAGGPPGSPDEDGDRYVEIWNLVFMQFDRSADGTLTPLPKPSVDTGMGLERVAAVMQGVHSNYEIDLFAGLIREIARTIGVDDLAASSLRVIADHIRACAFLVVDGVLPGREGRGYVLRRIIRRAIRHGYKLGVEEAFFYKLVEPLCRAMGDAYPELVESREHVERVLKKEELRFAETLSQGLGLLEASIADLDGTTIPGDVAFRLYDTYGFPVDLTADIARERGLSVDEDGFQAAMEQQRARARAASGFAGASDDDIASATVTSFSGYQHIDGESEVVSLYVDGAEVDAIDEGAEAIVVLHETPFYAESGGQVGDTGVLIADGVKFLVADTRKSGKAHLHVGTLGQGEIRIGDRLKAAIDADRREAIRRNHTATHLLHAALRNVLGDHVQQKGSLVAPDRLRFDFSHYEAVSPEQIRALEDSVNQQIRNNVEACTRLMDYEDALDSGAVALFGEKYDAQVRVLSLGDYSVELCGGTHVTRTGNIGQLRIVGESGVASGVRRIEAVTGEGALEWGRESDALLADIAGQVRASRSTAVEKVSQLVTRNRTLEKEISLLKQKLAAGGAGSDPLSDAEEIDGLRVLSLRVDGADPGTLRATVDRLKDRLGDGVVVVGAVADGKVRLAAGVSKSATDRVKAGELISAVAGIVGGRGGGRPDFAQAGGPNAGALDEALASVKPWVRERLNNN